MRGSTLNVSTLSPGATAEGERHGDHRSRPPQARALISQKVFIQLFRKSHFPHKSVNLFFILVIVKGKLTDLCGS